MKAYDRVDVPAWSLANGKDIIFSYSGTDQAEGAQMLQQALEMLADNESQAILSLRVYDDHDGRKITNKTEWTNSFPFALFDPEDGMVHQPRGKSQLLARIDALEKQLAETEEEKPAGFMGKIGAILDRPEIQDRLMSTVIGMVQNIFGQTNKPAAMGSVPGQQPPAAAPAGDTQGSNFDKLSADQQEKIKQAMEVLMARDPQLGDHLLKLAQMSVDKYKMALTFL
jgi:hypothetical protein